MRNKICFISTMLLMLNSFNSVAQSTENVKQESFNYLEILLVTTSIILVLVIWALSQVLVTISKAILKKKKNGLILKSLMIIIMTTALASSASSQNSLLITGMKENKNYGGMNAVDFYVLSTVIAIEIGVILFLSLMVRRSFKELSEESDKEVIEKTSKPKLAKLWAAIDKKWLTRAIPIEKEADFLLDHDYDGIRELDNALPPWWKYGFYVTLVIAVFYMMNFHVWGTGKNPEQEYTAEMEAGKKDEELYKMKTKDLVDENNVAMADALGIEAGKNLYMQSCIACHGAKGEGGIGPNLTDEYWIHGGSMNNIYHTIKIGYPEKGMQSWQSMYSPVQMKNLASYVKSIKGTKSENAKGPQGELYQENEIMAVDSTVNQGK